MLRHLLSEKQHVFFKVEIIRALNVMDFLSDCARVGLRRHKKNYTTKMAMIDEMGNAVWNEQFLVPVTLFRDRRTRLFSSKKFLIRIRSSMSRRTPQKPEELFCNLDFSHYIALEPGNHVSVNLPLFAPSNKILNAVDNSMRVKSEWSVGEHSMGKSVVGIHGKPELMIRVERLDEKVILTMKNHLRIAGENEDAETVRTIGGFASNSTDEMEFSPSSIAGSVNKRIDLMKVTSTDVDNGNTTIPDAVLHKNGVSPLPKPDESNLIILQDSSGGGKNLLDPEVDLNLTSQEGIAVSKVLEDPRQKLQSSADVELQDEEEVGVTLKSREAASKTLRGPSSSSDLYSASIVKSFQDEIFSHVKRGSIMESKGGLDEVLMNLGQRRGSGSVSQSYRDNVSLA